MSRSRSCHIRSRPIGAALIGVLVMLPPTLGAVQAAALFGRRPVPGRVVAPFRPPATRFGQGHLGVDFAAAPGTEVVAIDAGIVVFAGAVAGAWHVVVRDDDSTPGRVRRISYSYLARLLVHSGAHVRPGDGLGTTGGRGPHHDGGVVHIGLRLGDTYVDPMQLFGAGDAAARVHLAPAGEPPVRPEGGFPAPVVGHPGERAELAAGLGDPAPPLVARRPGGWAALFCRWLAVGADRPG